MSICMYCRLENAVIFQTIELDSKIAVYDALVVPAHNKCDQ